MPRGHLSMSVAAGLVAAAIWGASDTGRAHAADCSAGKPRAGMTNQDAQAVYDCLKDAMYENYNKGDKGWIPVEFVKDYRNWKPANTLPAAPGFHGERYLYTYVNPIGYDEYTAFKDENVNIPAGTLIAKESFDVAEDGKASAGPLFIMQKVAAGTSPKTNDWYYMMVMPNGAPAAVPVEQACSQCHMENFGFRGGLGYPVEDVRVRK